MDNVAFEGGSLKLLSVKKNPDLAQVFQNEIAANEGVKKDANGKEAEYSTVNMEGNGVIIQEEIGVEKEQATEPYPDMGKEDLLRFSETTFWKRARLISILIFWLAWLALLGAVIGLTIVAPRCGSPPEPKWWQKAVMYQVYIRSFYDSDADGIGDIQGIADKIQYIKGLGADAILISSFYESDDDSDFGYEVIDHKAVNSSYGTMTDIENLIQLSHDNNISVILDFIPNYTSKQHPWFVEFLKSGDYTNKFWNYYVWSNLANNWQSVYGQPAWTLGRTPQFCLHQFLPTEPELNLRSKSVQDEMTSILEFWMNKGVDGFRVIASSFLFENQDLTDNPCTGNSDDCRSNTQSQLEVYDMVARWRDLLDNFKNRTDRERVLLTDGDVSVTEAMNYYGTHGSTGANFPINYQLTKINSTCDSACISDLVYDWMYLAPDHATANWLTGDQDRSRLTSNVGETLVTLVNMIKMTLPGSTLIYYGEEIGMANGQNANKDPAGNIDPKYSRDGFRSPMQWKNDSVTGGFTNSTPWIPVANSAQYNVEDQEENDDSILNKFRKLSQLRRDEKSLQFGTLHRIDEPNVFAFVREYEGFNRVIAVGCFGSEAVVCGVDLTRNGLSSISIPWSSEVVFITDSSVPYNVGDTADLSKVSLSSGQGFVAKWKYTRP